MIIKGKIINEEYQEWVADFNFEVDSNISIPLKENRNFETLTDFILDIQDDEEINDKLKIFIREINIKLDNYPIIIYTEVDDLDMNCLYLYKIEEKEEYLDECKRLLKEDDEEIIGEFLSNSTYSIESLLEM